MLWVILKLSMIGKAILRQVVTRFIILRTVGHQARHPQVLCGQARYHLAGGRKRYSPPPVCRQTRCPQVLCGQAHHHKAIFAICTL